MADWMVLAAAAALALCRAAAASDGARHNGYVSLSLAEGRITSLRFDSKGRGQYGLETVASGGAIEGVKSVSVRGNEIVLEPSEQGVRWQMPFVKRGYYDADAHINYPSEKSLEGAFPLTLPAECFIGSAGHYLRIEHFKRLPDGSRWSTLNIRGGSRVLIRGDWSQNWDLELWLPGLEDLPIDPREDRLILDISSLRKPARLAVLPRGARDVPGSGFLMPEARFTPDTPVTYAPTGKSLPVSRAVTEFMRMGIYWHARPNCLGEWAVAADLHVGDDPRSWYLKALRRELLEDFGWIGYDRFGHFGYQFAWERYPDYGAISWRPWTDDLRMLHVNGIRIRAVADYALATGDTAFLRARRCRMVSTDGNEPQPVCGANADTPGFVLAAGDISPDGRGFANKHSLGQEFTAQAPFTRVFARLGNPSASEANSGRLRLCEKPGGATIAETEFSIGPGSMQDVPLDVGRQLSPGRYYLELADNDSGRRYEGPGITWLTELESGYSGGDAYNGPARATVLDGLQALFDYMRNHMGAARENIAYHQNNPEYNVPNYKSGVHLKCAPNCYWEGAGGGYDAYVAIWYNAASRAMAQISEMLGDSPKADYYRRLGELADEAYRRVFWRTVTENDGIFGRFIGCIDWEGKEHDFGFTYYNLEAAYRGIAAPEQARSILWWLDRGYYSPDGGRTWVGHPYSIWELFPPFNTIENSRWLQFCGTLPWLQVLTNGCNRLDCTARDLAVRSRYLSVDNMHERNERVLARFLSPDRLTGGRTNTSHWIGRWHFLEPDSDLADIEGFREIFPQGGIAASYQPAYYLGMEYTASGLRLAPRVPSAYDSVEFRNIGCRGCVFDFKAEAVRTAVLEEPVGKRYQAVSSGRDAVREFSAPAAFSKAGVLVRIRPFARKSYNGLTLVLEEACGGGWKKIAENRLNHVQDGQWVWVDAGRPLPGARRYRVRAAEPDPAEGEKIEILCGAAGPSLRLAYERTRLQVRAVYKPAGLKCFLDGGPGHSSGPGEKLEMTLEPGQSARLVVTRQD